MSVVIFVCTSFPFSVRKAGSATLTGKMKLIEIQKELDHWRVELELPQAPRDIREARRVQLGRFVRRPEFMESGSL
jgi:hypothetical protein